jgi:hypothetical protein
MQFWILLHMINCIHYKYPGDSFLHVPDMPFALSFLHHNIDEHLVAYEHQNQPP